MVNNKKSTNMRIKNTWVPTEHTGNGKQSDICINDNLEQVVLQLKLI
jgi:hypothetical protein